MLRIMDVLSTVSIPAPPSGEAGTGPKNVAGRVIRGDLLFDIIAHYWRMIGVAGFCHDGTGIR